MPLYRHADKVILYVHVPKTGGSTLEEVLKDSGARQALKYHKRLEYSASTPQHMHWDLLKNWIQPEFYDYSLALVRNPFSRMVSEYRWRESLVSDPLPDFDEWALRQFQRYASNRFVLDNHIRPQTAFLGPGVEIFRLEDGLEVPIRAAMTKLGLPTDDLQIHHARRSTHALLTASAETIARIAEFYASDFETLGYSSTDVPSNLFGNSAVSVV